MSVSVLHCVRFALAVVRSESRSPHGDKQVCVCVDRGEGAAVSMFHYISALDRRPCWGLAEGAKGESPGREPRCPRREGGRRFVMPP